MGFNSGFKGLMYKSFTRLAADFRLTANQNGFYLQQASQNIIGDPSSFCPYSKDDI